MVLLYFLAYRQSKTSQRLIFCSGASNFPVAMVCTYTGWLENPRESKTSFLHIHHRRFWDVHTQKISLSTFAFRTGQTHNLHNPSRLLNRIIFMTLTIQNQFRISALHEQMKMFGGVVATLGPKVIIKLAFLTVCGNRNAWNAVPMNTSFCFVYQSKHTI